MRGADPPRSALLCCPASSGSRAPAGSAPAAHSLITVALTRPRPAHAPRRIAARRREHARLQPVPRQAHAAVHAPAGGPRRGARARGRRGGRHVAGHGARLGVQPGRRGRKAGAYTPSPSSLYPLTLLLHSLLHSRPCPSRAFACPASAFLPLLLPWRAALLSTRACASRCLCPSLSRAARAQDIALLFPRLLKDAPHWRIAVVSGTADSAVPFVGTERWMECLKQPVHATPPLGRSVSPRPDWHIRSACCFASA